MTKMSMLIKLARQVCLGKDRRANSDGYTISYGF